MLTHLIDLDAPLVSIASGMRFTEGPIWRGSHLLFSDVPNKRIVRWRRLPEGPELTTFTTGMSNGLTLDTKGRLVAAGHDARCVYLIEEDGTRTVLASHFENKRLNSPNDIVVRSDGSIYFTDPPYAVTDIGMAGRPRPDRWWELPVRGKEVPYNGVYRIDPKGVLHLVSDELILPNGLAFSPDERSLYVVDSAHRHVKRFAVDPVDGSLSDGRVFLDMNVEEHGVPDGLKVDFQGNVFCAGPGGLWVCAADGEVLGRIRPPELPLSNLAWGEDGTVLFLTTRTSVHRLQTLTTGATPGRPDPAST
jgi:gluconolactonase